MNLPEGCFEQAMADCWRMWNELAESGDKKKPDWAREKYIFGCAACQVSADLSRVKDDQCCTLCPVDEWRQHADSGYTLTSPCEHFKALFYEWCICDDINERKILAAKIRDMKWSHPIAYVKDS